jgi:hypothetical protein
MIEASNKISSITYRKGNIFQFARSLINAESFGTSVLIPHVCNNVNAFGAGFAKCVADEYPIAKANYHMLGPSFLKNNPGHVQIVEAEQSSQYNHKILIANMICQNGLKNHKNPRPLNYYYLVKSMANIGQYVRTFKKNDPSLNIQIHCPKFGSGLAGGNWNFIKCLIEDMWLGIPTYVYEL